MLCILKVMNIMEWIMLLEIVQQCLQVGLNTLFLESDSLSGLLAVPLDHCVTISESMNLSVSGLPPLKNSDINTTYLIVVSIN